MKKGLWLFLFVMIFGFTTNSLVLGADVIKLKAANFLPVTHPITVLTGWFCEEMKKRTNGKVEITHYGGGTLLDPVKMYDGVTTGITDIGYSHIQYTRGRFPVMEVFDLPLGFPSGWAATQVADEFYNKHKPKEWEAVHPFLMTINGPNVLLIAKKPVRTLEDLKGLKIRATGQFTDVMKALGALPIPLQVTDVYEALRRGVIDGVIVDISTLKAFKFAEEIKYVTSTTRLGAGITFYWVMNNNKWKALPPDIQKAFTELASEFKEKHALLWNQIDIAGMDFFKSLGGELIPLSEGEVGRWIKAVEPVTAEYKKNMVAKGYKEAEVDDWLKSIKERIDYWQKEEKKRGIPTPF